MYVNDKPTCCVTHDLVEEVSWTNPALFRANGKPKLYDVLYYLGFHVKFNTYSKNVSKHKNTLIRSSEDSERCYYTKVYKGTVRKAIKNVINGETDYYNHQLHHLADEYQKHEVLQPENLSKYVCEEDLLWVRDFGGTAKSSDFILSEEF